MLNHLTDKLTSTLSKFKLKKRLTEENIHEGVREIRLALIEADVNLKVIKKFISRVKEQSLGEEVLKHISSGDMFTKIVHDNLVHFLGGEGGSSLTFEPPTKISNILLCGLQGSGKTTTCGKLANRLKKSRDILLVSLDTYRPAANEQLKVLAEQCGVAFYDRGNEKNLKKIIKAANKHAQKKIHNCIIWDTAGRTQVDESLMKELAQVTKIINPCENILVVDAMTGQQAVSVAEAFNQAVTITSLLFTKFDSETRGGAVLSVKEIVGVPIKLIGVGEKISDLDEFVPSRIADRMLGMGDVIGLVNKAQEVFDEEQSEKLNKKLKNKEFDLQDFFDQIKQMKKFGSVENLLGMIPGMSGKLKDANVDESQFDKAFYIIQSMTRDEKNRPFIINNKRKQRIAIGSGTSVVEINKILKKFKEMKSMMSKMSSPAKMKKMMKQVMGENMDNSMLQSMEDKFSGL